MWIKILTYSWLHADFRYALIYESNADNQSFLSIYRTRIKKDLFFDWKRGDVVSKMSRRFFVFCTKNKMFCTDFRANKLRNFFSLATRLMELHNNLCIIWKGLFPQDTMTPINALSLLSNISLKAFTSIRNALIFS